MKESEWDITKHCACCKEPIFSEHHKDPVFNYYSKFGVSCPKKEVPFEDEST